VFSYTIVFIDIRFVIIFLKVCTTDIRCIRFIFPDEMISFLNLKIVCQCLIFVTPAQDWVVPFGNNPIARMTMSRGFITVYLHFLIYITAQDQTFTTDPNSIVRSAWYNYSNWMALATGEPRAVAQNHPA